MTVQPATLTLPAPAKINLFLHITGRRNDGYHELQTLFRLLDHGDRLHFTPDDSGQIRLSSDAPELATPDNLATRAARALKALPGTPSRHGVRIRLEKRLPAGAGLGGGSSDAATTLLALNHLWQMGLDTSRLAATGLQLGADVPVFIHGHSAWATGIGERLEPVELPPSWYLVLTPACPVSTAEVFSHRELTRNGSAIKMSAFLAGHSRNDCESLVRRLYPAVDRTLTELGQYAEARLTGTGSSVFAAFTRRAAAEAALEQILDRATGPLDGLQGFIARGLDRSPALDVLEGLQTPVE
ncbi:MAG: 4-(cytidine 5'-diphospho)-2-C-methyl-D-erythritol kinase [Pseudohongiellaceae bacterium]